MPGTMDVSRVSASLGAQLGMSTGLPIRLASNFGTMVVVGVDDTELEMSSVDMRDRTTRLDGNVRELYHQTDEAGCRAILSSNTMKRGSTGIAGGGIYFATSPEQTQHKAHSKGFIFRCRVRLGNVDHWPAHRIDKNITFRKLSSRKFDSVHIPRPGGHEYVVYNSDQVELVEVCRVNSNGSVGPWRPVQDLDEESPSLESFLNDKKSEPEAQYWISGDGVRVPMPGQPGSPWSGYAHVPTRRQVLGLK